MEIKNNGEAADIAVVMVPLPAQGHLNQLLHLSRLISSYKIPVHYVGTTTHNRQARLRLQNWDLAADSDLHFHDFSLPPFETTPPPNPDSPDKFPTQIIPLFFATSHLRHPLEALVRRLCGAARRVVVVYDSAMAWVLQDIPSLPNAECYLFNSVSAFQIYTYFMEVAGKPFPADGPQVLREIPSLDGNFPDEFWDYWHIQEKFLGNSAGVLHNTCRVIEGQFLDLFEKEGVLGSLKQWAVGPFNPVEIPERTDSDDKRRRHESLHWLDNQPRNSVVFVSFGTTTTLSGQQIKELASGLEKSRQKFVWVLRDADNADIFSGDDSAGRRADQLPEGYEERVRGRGIIVRDWAPQLDILAHPATCGFITHCGWNSCMESMSMGVPMVAWPMHSDQPRNSVLITKFLGIGILVRDWERRREVVTSTTIEQCIALLMDTPEGEEMRRKAADLSAALKRSVMDGGGTRKELDSFIFHITR